MAWGENAFGETKVPPTLSTVVAVAAGWRHSLALRADGTVVAWGRSDLTNVPPGLTEVVAIAAGYEGSLALRANGTVASWGLGGALNVHQGVSNVVAIAAGSYHSVALQEDGRLIAWGSNVDGQTNVPSDLSNVVAVTAGESHNLALVGLPEGTAAPQLIGPRRLVAVVDHPFHYRIPAKNGVTSYGAQGLPEGLALDSITGLITGQPNVAGVFPVVLWATNDIGVSQLAVAIFVNLPLPVVIGSYIAAGIGNNFVHHLLTANAIRIDASGLPAGLAIDNATGLISGVPWEPGDFPVTLVASNRYGTASASMTIRISPVIGWGNNSAGQTNAPKGLSNIVSLAAGEGHNLALRADGTVAAWGTNRWGQTNVPMGLSNVVAIAAGRNHSLALRLNGTVVAWGWNGSGQTNVPIGLTNAVAIAAGERHGLALRADGTVIGWGNNFEGQTKAPGGLNRLVAIAAGADHSLALQADGHVAAWGGNSRGQTNIPSGLSDVVAIAAGEGHSIALRANGTVVAWGERYELTNAPAGLRNVIAIAAGRLHSLALREHGSVAAWGFGDQGATQVPSGLTNIVGIAGGALHSLALAGASTGVAPPQLVGSRRLIGVVDHSFYYRIFANGATSFSAEGLPAGLVLDSSTGIISGRPTEAGAFSILITASNEGGTSQWAVTLNLNLPVPMIATDLAVAHLGNNFVHSPITPDVAHVEAVGLPPGLAIDSQAGTISGVPQLVGDFPVSLLASNHHGLSSGTLIIRVTPVAAWGNNLNGQSSVPNSLSNVVAIAAGREHSLALRSDGTVVAWGTSLYGLTNVVSLRNVVAIAAGNDHSIALRADGTVIAWGWNGSGQTNVPAGLSNVVAISAGATHSMALRDNGTVAAWSYTSYLTNVPAGLTNVVAVAAGGSHSLALLADGRVAAWGSGSATNVPDSLTNVVAIAAAGNYSLALRTDGTVVDWGSAAPYVPPGLSNVVAIDTKGVRFALRSDGTVVGWGPSSYGETNVPSGLTNLVSLAAGGFHSLALLRQDSVHDPLLRVPFATPGFAAEAFGTPGLSYELQRADELQGPWLPTRPVSFTNSFQTIPLPPPTNPAQFYRLRRH